MSLMKGLECTVRIPPGRIIAATAHQAGLGVNEARELTYARSSRVTGPKRHEALGRYMAVGGSLIGLSIKRLADEGHEHPDLSHALRQVEQAVRGEKARHEDVLAITTLAHRHLHQVPRTPGRRSAENSVKFVRKVAKLSAAKSPRPQRPVASLAKLWARAARFALLDPSPQTPASTKPDPHPRPKPQTRPLFHRRNERLQRKLPPRFLVNFGSREALRCAEAIENPFLVTPVRIEEMGILSVTIPPHAAEDRSANRALDRLLRSFQARGAKVRPEFRFDLDTDALDDDVRHSEHAIELDEGDGRSHGKHLRECLIAMGIDPDDPSPRGKGVSIAVVDTGVNGTAPEFVGRVKPGLVSSSEIEEGEVDALVDENGHGTMVACIAAGGRGHGSRFQGVAPDATLLSYKTDFYETSLTEIYLDLGRRARAGEKIVANNSWGVRTGTPPPDGIGRLGDLGLYVAMAGAIDAGVAVVFSAGNNHELAGGKPDACHPTTIWLNKCRSDVLTVGAVDEFRAMWFYSSRGPGQWAGKQHCCNKPDLVAITPKDGVILYGDDVLQHPIGWGTSGAAPQVSGICAIEIASNPVITPSVLFSKLKEHALDLGHSSPCQGHGLVRCTH